MLSMTTSTAHVALYDDLADWEFGHLFVELRTGRFTGHPWKVVSVAGSREPITSMGGLRIVPDMILDDLDPAHHLPSQRPALGSGRPTVA
jgi:hypothetical protein